MPYPIKVFCCYAREDKEMLEKLMKHLMPLQRQGQITIWSDRDIGAGLEWEKELHNQLESADLILLLISPDFMASDYCYKIEMRRAIERHNQGNARVIPILLRQAFWQQAPFAHLQMMPSDARPITSWSHSDDALNEITMYISQIVSELHIGVSTSTSIAVIKDALTLLHEQEKDWLKTSSHQETGTLIVWTKKENRGISVYLLPRNDFFKAKSSAARDNHKLKKKGTITTLRIGSYPLFIARFRDLEPGFYNVWTGWGLDNPRNVPIQIDKGDVSELELDWEN